METILFGTKKNIKLRFNLTMGSKKELKPSERREIWNKRQEGYSYKQIAGKFTFYGLILKLS